jgi:FKBP-type peptidyl-prolyl cis-trans isomerase SlyD
MANALWHLDYRWRSRHHPEGPTPSESRMQIEKNKVVTFHYTLNDAEGSYTESTEGKEPAKYLHGYGGIVRGLEREMKGKQAGDEFSVTVQPEDAFGLRHPGGAMRVPIKHLVRPGKLAPGKVVAVNTDQGQRQAIVVKVGRFNVDIDFNHPMAGKTFVFDVKIVDVRDATPEEIEHRHVHGPGGAQH